MSVSGDDWIQDAFQTEKCNENNEITKQIKYWELD